MKIQMVRYQIIFYRTSKWETRLDNAFFFRFLKTYLSISTESCAYIENEMFYAKFYNYDQYPIDILMYDQEWNKLLVRPRLNPGNEYSHETYFTQNYLFKRSDTNERLKCSANGITAHVFEGCRFKATEGRLIMVNISRGNA